MGRHRRSQSVRGWRGSARFEHGSAVSSSARDLRASRDGEACRIGTGDVRRGFRSSGAHRVRGIAEVAGGSATQVGHRLLARRFVGVGIKWRREEASGCVEQGGGTRGAIRLGSALLTQAGGELIAECGEERKIGSPVRVDELRRRGRKESRATQFFFLIFFMGINVIVCGKFDQIHDKG